MSFFCHLSRALAILILLITWATAQKCYFPDGTLASKHTACAASGSDSACCASDAFCLDNGLCFQEGIVTRGSCTDESWDSAACGGYCKQENPGGSVAITPCKNDGSESTFVCGLNNTRCRNESQTFSLLGSSAFVLRPAQVTELVAPALSSLVAQASASAASTQKATASCSPAQTMPLGLYYTPAQMAGLGAGLGIPLLIAACTAFLLWKKERARNPRLMYQLPDDEIIDFKPPPPGMFPAHPAVRSIPPSREGNMSDLAAFRMGIPTGGRETPTHMRLFQERYQAMNMSHPQEQYSFELDGQPVGSAFRFTTHGKPVEREKTITSTTIELGNRTSTTTTKSARDRDRDRGR